MLFILNDKRFFGVFSKFFFVNCKNNPTNLYIFLFCCALLLFAIITIPRFRLQGNKLQVKPSQIQNLEVNIIGVVPFYLNRFYSITIGNTFINFFREISRPKSRKVRFMTLTRFIIGLILSITLVIIYLFLYLALITFPMLSCLLCFTIFFPELLADYNKDIIAGLMIMCLVIFTAFSIFILVRSEKSTINARKIKLLIDSKNKVLRVVKGPKEDIPLHTLNSFRRHPLYPTGIIHNNSFLLNSPTIDWRIETNQGVGNTDELIEYLNDLILQAKIEENVRIEKLKELIELIQNNGERVITEYFNENKQSLINSISKWVKENVK